jgi:tRNA-2-methylthio-N6-dimethylallyladenosine synthase
VLLEKPGRYPGQIVGRSPYLHPVQVMAPAEMIGDIAAVTITEVSANSLFGTLVGSVVDGRARTAAASTQLMPAGG